MNQHPPTHEPDLPRKGMIFLTILSMVAGLVWFFLSNDPSSNPAFGGRIFYHMFVHYDFPILIFFIFTLLLLFFFSSKKKPSSLPQLSPFTIAISTLILTALGSGLIYHHFPFSMDEYAAIFQAEIFRHGRVFGTIPEELKNFAGALTPHFIHLHKNTSQWIANYLPGYSLLLAGAGLVHLDLFLNPILAALSIFALSGVLGQLWPKNRTAQTAGLLLLASSPQFLVTSMSRYSMPAHLCLNLIWLFLHLRGGKKGHGLAPWIGILALNLHQPSVHALFVIPFLLRLLWTRQWKQVLYYGTVYLLGILLAFSWLHLKQPPPPSPTLISQASSTSPSLATSTPAKISATAVYSDAIQAPHWWQSIIQTVNIVMFVSWQSPALIILLFAGLLSCRAMDSPLRCVTAGIILTFFFYFLVNQDQGHGWGYRYLHGVLGNGVVIAVWGLLQMPRLLPHLQANRLILGSTLLALLILLPIRCSQVNSMVQPYARAHQFLVSLDAPFLVVDTRTIWYGADIIRNDPFLREKPFMLWQSKLTEKQIVSLSQRGKVRIITFKDLESLDVKPMVWHRPLSHE